jgi:hypothetical protein
MPFHRPPTRILVLLGTAIFVASFLVSAGPLRATAIIKCSPSLVPLDELATISNGKYVTPGATASSEFTVTSGSVNVLSLMTYHQVAPDGLPSTGQIGLRSSKGKVYGPWQTTGGPGPGDVPNAFWTTTIDIELPAGTYTVTDSDPTTWSANASTGGAGMFWVTGYRDSGVVEPATPVAAPAQLYTVSNGGYVTPGASAPSHFTVTSGSVTVLSLMTYHQVAPDGLPSTGQIGLRSSDGKIYGPWQTTGGPGPGGVPNAFWTATIDVVLPPGTYTVTDSDPTTWSANAGTGGAGMFWVTGYQK